MYIPPVSLLTVTTDYARELFAELKTARQLARQNIGKAQAAQKTRYDKVARGNIKVKEGDLVMLKIQPHFKLDHSFRAPYRLYTVTDTCAQSTSQTTT